MITSKWGEGLSVGDKVIDGQHKMYFDLLRDLSLAVDENSSKERFLRLFSAFELFIRFHFKTEENAMLDSNYPEYKGHSGIHRACLDMVKQKRLQYEEDEFTASQFLAALYEWFVLHISSEDKKLGNHLKSLQSAKSNCNYEPEAI